MHPRALRLTIPCVWLMLLLALQGLGCKPQETGAAKSAAPSALLRRSSHPIQLQDLQGHTVRPLELSGERAKVLIFLGAECPISDAYVPEINRLCDRFGRRNVTFDAVYEDGDLPVTEVRGHASAFGFHCPVLMDPTHVLARRVGAVATPEAAVITKDGMLAYRGRIDNQFPSLGEQRPAATRQDLRIALEQLLAGRTIVVSRTRAVGCAIE